MHAPPSRFSLTLALTAAIFTALGNLNAGEPEARRHFLEGWYQETAEREPEKAIAAYRKVLEARGPERLSAKALLRIGLCLRAVGKGDEAQAVFRELIEKHPGESDLTIRAQRYLEGKEDTAAAGLPPSDRRVEVLSLVEDMAEAQYSEADIARFLGVLRLATPEYVRDVVLAKHPFFGVQAAAALRSRKPPTDPELRPAGGRLPDADVLHLLTFVGIPAVRTPIFLYIAEKRDTSAIPDLRRLLDGADADLRYHAAFALGMLGAKDAEARIIEIFKHQTRPERLTDLARSLAVLKSEAAPQLIAERILNGTIDLEIGVTLISGMAVPEAVAALRPLLLSESNAHLEAWQHLTFPPESPFLAEVIAAGLASGDPRHTFCALRQAVRSTRRQAVHSIDNPSVQEKILPKLADVVLARLDDPESPALVEFLKQRAYKQYLGLRGPTELDCPPWLARLVDELSRAVRFYPKHVRLVAPFFRRLLSTPLEPYALRFFIEHWQELPDLLKMLAAGSKEERSEAVRSMVAYGTPALLVRVGTDTSVPFEVRAPIIRKLSPGATFNKDIIEILPVVTAALRDPDPGIVLTALEITSEFLARVRRLNSSPTSAAHHAAAATLKDSVHRILAATNEKQYSPELRSVAFGLLAETGDESSLLIALEDPLPRLRLKAADRLQNYDPAYARAVELGDLRVQRQFFAALVAESVREKRTGVDRQFRQRYTYGVPPSPAVWVSRIEALFGSEHEEIRRSLLRLLKEKRGSVGAVLAMPILRCAIKDPSAQVRKAATDLLVHYDEWETLLSVWDELVSDNPGLAIDTAHRLDRLDLVRTFLNHPQEEVQRKAHEVIWDRAGPEDAPAFLTNPHAGIRFGAAETLASQGRFHELARALSDPNAEVAAFAYRTLTEFSTELKNAFGPISAKTPEEFTELPVEQRAKIAEELRTLTKKRGPEIRIGRGKELLATADELTRQPGFKENRDLRHKARKLRLAAVTCLTTAFPHASAVETLIADPRIEPDMAAEAFMKSGMKEAFKRLWRHRNKDEEVSDALLNGLVLFGAISELKQLAGDPEPGGKVDYRFLRALARSGEGRLAARHVENQYTRNGADATSRYRASCVRSVIEASAEGGADGPIPFLELLSSHPELRDEGTVKCLMAAVKKSRSASNLLKVLDELPEPPAQYIFRALIELGQPETVLEQALTGPFWLEAATALHDATGRWNGYFGPDDEEPEAPTHAGLFLIEYEDEEGSVARQRVLFNDRRKAVEAWRQTLNRAQGPAPEQN
jgi:HEAT repeat protein